MRDGSPYACDDSKVFIVAGEHSVWRGLRRGYVVVSARRWLGSFQRQYLMRRSDEMKLDPTWTPDNPEQLPTFAAELDAVMALLADPVERARMQRELLELVGAKSALYATESGIDSCLVRAWGGLHHNLMRKFDRIAAVGKRWGVDAAPTELDHLLAQEAAKDGEAESLYATMRDMVAYGLHAMRYIKAQMDAQAAAEKPGV